MIGAKKTRRAAVEVNAGSMADVAFLLLIFFLVATTIVNDKAMKQVLPPYLDKPIDVKIAEQNVLNIIINNSNELLVENKVLKLREIRKKTKAFITNNGRDVTLSDSPTKAIVSIKGFRGTDYGFYVQVYNEVHAAYDELRAEKLGLSMRSYLELMGVPEKELTPEELAAINQVKSIYPLQISEAEQE
jgi:biopolymer transport protein ExbD